MIRGRVIIAVVLILSLVAAGLARDLAQRHRHATDPDHAPVEGGQTLAGMDSFALALLLGGMRGPLVMFLWTSSEAQKGERELADFDTKVEWIRLLQPEFDSVHIFQIWNKAYNISVQMASLANKYTTIIDAIDYARSVDRQRPNNINIISQIASVYFDKLGNSQEKIYYRQRVREETRHRAVPARQRNDPAWQRLQLDPLLDEQGNILPQYLRAMRPRPADLPPDAEWNNGAELQYLEKYQPYPYGVSTFALGYNYYKQAQVLHTVGRQQHIQLSPMVVDSRPALALRNWAEEEWDRGRRAEMRAFGLPVHEETLDMELPTAALGLDAELVNPAAADEAMYSYRRIMQLVPDAEAEYDRHLRNPDHARNIATYRSHRDALQALRLMAQGDHDYLAAMQTQGEQRDALVATARQHYRDAFHMYQLIILRYYVDVDIAERAYPAGYNRQNIHEVPGEQYAGILERVRRVIQTERGGFDGHWQDREEYELHVERAGRRLQQLEQAGRPG